METIRHDGVDSAILREGAFLRQHADSRVDSKMISSGTCIRIKDLTIDAEACRVWVRGEEVELTSREFDVLLYLAGNAGRLVTSNELLDAVWGTEAVIGDAALRTVIMRLRRKLGDDPESSRYIFTVWGRGYRLAG